MHRLFVLSALLLPVYAAAQPLPPHAVPLNPGLPWTDYLLEEVQAVLGESVHVFGTRMDTRSPSFRYILYAR